MPLDINAYGEYDEGYEDVVLTAENAKDYAKAAAEEAVKRYIAQTANVVQAITKGSTNMEITEVKTAAEAPLPST